MKTRLVYFDTDGICVGQTVLDYEGTMYELISLVKCLKSHDQLPGTGRQQKDQAFWTVCVTDGDGYLPRLIYGD